MIVTTDFQEIKSLTLGFKHFFMWYFSWLCYQLWHLAGPFTIYSWVCWSRRYGFFHTVFDYVFWNLFCYCWFQVGIKEVGIRHWAHKFKAMGYVNNFSGSFSLTSPIIGKPVCFGNTLITHLCILCLIWTFFKTTVNLITWDQ